jgi:hypothetical protein
MPHEQAEDATVYPAVARLLGGKDPTGTMTRGHLEIAHLVRLLSRLLEEMPAEGPSSDDLVELRPILYGLHAILRLHFAQEDESFLPLLAGAAEPPAGPPDAGATDRMNAAT